MLSFVLLSEVTLQLFDVVRLLVEHVVNALRQGEPNQMLNGAMLDLATAAK